MLCAICGKRKPKRHCPGVHGEICAICCGEEREKSVTCPLDCSYLQDAHRYEAARSEDQPLKEALYEKYQVSQAFMHRAEMLINALTMILYQRSLELPAVQDSDIMEAIDALIKTHETLDSGIIYESLPTAPVPEGLFRAVQEFIDNVNKDAESKGQIEGSGALKEDDIIRSLVLLARVAASYNNGRPRCRAYLSSLRSMFPAATPKEKETASGLIIPG